MLVRATIVVWLCLMVCNEAGRRCKTKLLTDETKKDPTSVIETEVEWKAWLKWATDKSIQTCEYAEKQCKTEDSCFKNKMDCKDLAKTWMTLASDESLHVFGVCRKPSEEERCKKYSPYNDMTDKKMWNVRIFKKILPLQKLKKLNLDRTNGCYEAFITCSDAVDTCIELNNCRDNCSIVFNNCTEWQKKCRRDLTSCVSPKGDICGHATQNCEIVCEKCSLKKEPLGWFTAIGKKFPYTYDFSCAIRNLCELSTGVVPTVSPFPDCVFGADQEDPIELARRTAHVADNGHILRTFTDDGDIIVQGGSAMSGNFPVLFKDKRATLEVSACMEANSVCEPYDASSDALMTMVVKNGFEKVSSTCSIKPFNDTDKDMCRTATWELINPIGPLTMFVKFKRNPKCKLTVVLKSESLMKCQMHWQLLMQTTNHLSTIMKSSYEISIGTTNTEEKLRVDAERHAKNTMESNTREDTLSSLTETFDSQKRKEYEQTEMKVKGTGGAKAGVSTLLSEDAAFNSGIGAPLKSPRGSCRSIPELGERAMALAEELGKKEYEKVLGWLDDESEGGLTKAREWFKSNSKLNKIKHWMSESDFAKASEWLNGKNVGTIKEGWNKLNQGIDNVRGMLKKGGLADFGKKLGKNKFGDYGNQIMDFLGGGKNVNKEASDLADKEEASNKKDPSKADPDTPDDKPGAGNGEDGDKEGGEGGKDGGKSPKLSFEAKAEGSLEQSSSLEKCRMDWVSLDTMHNSLSLPMQKTYFHGEGTSFTQTRSSNQSQTGDKNSSAESSHSATISDVQVNVVTDSTRKETGDSTGIDLNLKAGGSVPIIPGVFSLDLDFSLGYAYKKGFNEIHEKTITHEDTSFVQESNSKYKSENSDSTIASAVSQSMSSQRTFKVSFFMTVPPKSKFNLEQLKISCSDIVNDSPFYHAYEGDSWERRTRELCITTANFKCPDDGANNVTMKTDSSSSHVQSSAFFVASQLMIVFIHFFEA